MRLAEFIAKNHEKIIKEWVRFARGIQPQAASMSETDLRDHAEQLLTDLVADMELPQSDGEQAEKSKGRGDERGMERAGRLHALQRLRSGFELDQVVSEFRALRASVLRLWSRGKGDESDEMTRFNEAIDEGLAESAQLYTDTVARTREQFLAMLGHDLRNPLGAILMSAQVMTRAEGIDDNQLRSATRILHSAERMNRMVGDLLDLTRTRLGSGIPITRAPTDLRVVCRQVLAEIEALHTSCEIRFDANGELRGEWDSDRLAQVVSNLAANAVQYGCAVGPVVVSAEGDDDGVVLRVHNGGAPIAQDAIATLFEPMVRAVGEAERGAHTTSLGLGLYIAREVVTAHGGKISVTSTASEGTTFTVCLPRRAPSAA